MASLQTKVRVLLLLLSFSILGALLYFSDIGKVAMVMSGSNPYYIFLAFLLSLFLMAVRTFRWRVLLGKIKVHIPFKTLFPVYMSGLFVSNLTPGKIGEPIRSYLLKKTAGISISKSLPSVLAERLSDVFLTVILSFAGVAIAVLPPNVEPILFAVIALYFSGAVVVLYVCSKKNRISAVSKKMLKLFGWFPFVKRFDKHVEHFAWKFNESLSSYKDVKLLSKTMALSLVIWCTEGIILYLSFLSVGINVDALVAISFLSISILIGVSSLLPGGIGSSEVVLVLLFTTVYPVPIYAATAAVFIERLFSTWINIIAGSMCIALFKNK